MRAIHHLMVAVLMLTLVTACKNRLETFEPYSSFDERMAAVESKPYYVPGQPGQVQQDPYADQFADMGDDRDMGPPQARPQPRQLTSSSSSNAEVPFASSRKKPMNIGALRE